MSRLAPDSARPARGFSLVEVLVALGLSLMVSMAALEHLRVAREASRAVSGRTDVQHQAALALDLIRSEIRRAGFRVDAHTSLEDAFAQQSFSLGEPAQSTTVPGAAVAYVSAASELWIRFQASGDRWDGDCLGQAPAAPGALIVERLWVDAEGLHCGVWRDQGYKSALLLEAVEAWALTVGVDTDLDGNVDSYAEARDVADWSAAVALQVRVRTVSARAEPGSTSAPFVDLDGTARTPGDLRVRRVASGIVPLKARAR
jgi:prepilin-type N-terminal cleavage/methylation domain-containing protein